MKEDDETHEPRQACGESCIVNTLHDHRQTRMMIMDDLYTYQVLVQSGLTRSGVARLLQSYSYMCLLPNLGLHSIFSL